MRTDKQEIEARMARFEDGCRKASDKLTHQRMAVFRAVAQTGDHPDAEMVFKCARKRMPTVSMDTVYRTLWWLRDLGLINTLGPPRESVRFGANLSHHHHFVCIQCRLSRDCYSEDLNRLVLPDSVQFIGHAEMIQVEVKGLCLKCAGEKTPGADK